jgi:hypothetical protein
MTMLSHTANFTKYVARQQLALGRNREVYDANVGERNHPCSWSHCLGRRLVRVFVCKFYPALHRGSGLLDIDGAILNQTA